MFLIQIPTNFYKIMVLFVCFMQISCNNDYKKEEVRNTYIYTTNFGLVRYEFTGDKLAFYRFEEGSVAFSKLDNNATFSSELTSNFKSKNQGECLMNSNNMTIFAIIRSDIKGTKITCPDKAEFTFLRCIDKDCRFKIITGIYVNNNNRTAIIYDKCRGVIAFKNYFGEIDELIDMNKVSSDALILNSNLGYYNDASLCKSLYAEH